MVTATRNSLVLAALGAVLLLAGLLIQGDATVRFMVAGTGAFLMLGGVLSVTGTRRHG